MNMHGSRNAAGEDESKCQSATKSTAWIDAELAGCTFQDARHGRRLKVLLSQFWNGIGKSIPLACQDWSNTKAAYRFFSNEDVTEDLILAGHFQSTAERFSATQGPVLVLQDTTEFTFQRHDPKPIGITRKVPVFRKYKDGGICMHTVCGILMHSSLAVTTEGVSLGLAAIKFWTRDKFKGSTALKRKINPTRVPIEQKESICWLENLRQSTALFQSPDRCVHVGDRGSDIYELYCTAHQLHTHFLVRICVDRMAGDGMHTIADEMEEVYIQGFHRIEVRDRHGNPSEALLAIRYRRVHVLPPWGKQKTYPDLTLTVIYAQEVGMPANREKIDWKLLTDLPVSSRKQAVEKLVWYSMRWKIETFHKILKSGCKAEDALLRSAQRLANLLSVFCIVSWRIFWMTMINRSSTNMSPTLVLTQTEINLLDVLVKDKRGAQPEHKDLSYYLIKVARLGGYLARSRDPPPGNTVMWRGMSRLIDIELGFNIIENICG